MEGTEAVERLNGLKPKLGDFFAYPGKRKINPPTDLEGTDSDVFNSMKKQRDKSMNELNTNNLRKGWAQNQIEREMGEIDELNVEDKTKWVLWWIRNLGVEADKTKKEIDRAFEKMDPKAEDYQKDKWAGIANDMKGPANHILSKLEEHDLENELEDILIGIREARLEKLKKKAGDRIP